MGFGSSHRRIFSLIVLVSVSSAHAVEAPSAEPAALPNAVADPAQLEKVTQEIYRLLEVVNRSKTGQALIAKAVKFWNLEDTKQLRRKITLGRVSRTDAVLTRHFNPITGEEIRERNVTVTIRANQALGDRVLDLAHELTHAIAEPSWDPYDPELTPGKYIHASLEAKGGEIEAVSVECEVARDLEDQGVQLSKRCDRYIGAKTRVVDRVLVHKDFYRVGEWKTEVARKLGAESLLFPNLSGSAPELYSATGGAPYPVSLLREYEELNKIACENAKRRARNSKGRSPASTALLKGRCHETESRVVNSAPLAEPVRQQSGRGLE